MKKTIWLFMGIGFISCSDKKAKTIETTPVSDTIAETILVKTTDKNSLSFPEKA